MEKTGPDIAQASGAMATVTRLPFDARWREATDAGNLAFDRGDYASAAADYQNAMVEAKTLFRQALITAPNFAAHIPPILVVACGNAARNEMARKRANRADTIMQDAASMFLQVLGDGDECGAMVDHCLRNLPRLLIDLTDPDFADAPGVAARQHLADRLTKLARKHRHVPVN